MNAQSLCEAVVAIDSWLDTMRDADGYGGPVVHWWRDSLAYGGVGLDWRYEGIVSGYLNLYRQTGNSEWLDKARRAGDDLVRGQTSKGVFRHSAFEINPLNGGTPHEAACDLALLRLACVLRAERHHNWEAYAATAERNLQAFVIGMLWDERTGWLRNTAYDETFVPNKAATTVEALMIWADLTGDESCIGAIVRPLLESIVSAQVHDQESPMHGAIAQGVSTSRTNHRYFPFYIARCIPSLVEGFRILGEAQYLLAAKAAMSFILRVRLPDGSFPQVVYRDGRINRYPQWIAATGDILRAMKLLQDQAMDIDTAPTLSWLMEGRQSSLSFRAAYGFDSLVSQHEPEGPPDFRDLIGVCGWVDKAFHYLTDRPEVAAVVAKPEPVGQTAFPCRYKGQVAIFREDQTGISVRSGPDVLYRWCKCNEWAEID